MCGKLNESEVVMLYSGCPVSSVWLVEGVGNCDVVQWLPYFLVRGKLNE